MSIHTIMQKFEHAMIEDVDVPTFRAGDTVCVRVKVVEGERERVQRFEGAVIARRNNGFNSSFTVRKISSGEGVERTFHLYSRQIEKIEVVRFGRVRRAKLYYLRDRSGKKARIKQRIIRAKKPVVNEEKA